LLILASSNRNPADCGGGDAAKLLIQSKNGEKCAAPSKAKAGGKCRGRSA